MQAKRGLPSKNPRPRRGPHRGAFAGLSRMPIGSLARGPVEMPVKFKVLFREPERELKVRLICGVTQRVTSWATIAVVAPTRPGARYVRIKQRSRWVPLEER